jgi:hypothetical protein
MADHDLKECRDVAVQIARITGLKTGYGNDYFKALEVGGSFVRIDLGDSKKISSRKIIKSRAAVLKILERFHKKYQPNDLGFRLILRNVGNRGDFLIVNQNAELFGYLSASSRRKIVKRHQEAFRQFAKFLRNTKVR